MKVFLIGMEERVMRDLAAALQAQGHIVTDSHEANTNLTGQIDQVIVGRQVQLDHPALQAVQRQGLPICSYAEFIHTYAQDKQRIVITGQEKHLICLLVLHVLNRLHKSFDYVINAPNPAGSVQLSDAPVIILEGDELPYSPIAPEPQSLYYQHHILLLGTMAWEANEAYPTLETYRQYITRLADASPKSGTLIYGDADKTVQAIASAPRADVQTETYDTHPHRQENGQVYLITPQGDVPFPAADPASIRAVTAALRLMRNLAITDRQFYEALANFHIDHLT
ncbi:MAG: hypothetical protein AAFQ01_00600 [Bacteroidota bacterium]